ncbi:MAG: hypothetical protein JXB00_20215 [Bacteroidales bacterium]|nr:hypothetical protein [Bacteroidales bacterium]
MNKLSLCLNFCNTLSELRISQHKLENGILELEIDRIPVFKSGGTFFYHDEELVAVVIGYVSNLSQLGVENEVDSADDNKVIANLYKSKGITFFGDVEGSFTILIWDLKKSKGYIFQDEFGSGIPLYYAGDRFEQCISTSLREILRKKTVKPKLNIAAARDFMVAKTIVPNKNTFVKSVFKLLPKHYLQVGIKARSPVQHKIRYKKHNISLDEAKSTLVSTLQESIVSLNEMCITGKRICTISAGYDSNAILHYLAGIQNNIEAFTIGGKKRNEIPNAKCLASLYPQVIHHTAIVGGDKLARFPDIVWRNEGYIFESGLFLQYELAGLLRKKGHSELMCGEAGDQILDQYRKSATRVMLKKDFKAYVKYLLLERLWPEYFRETKLFKYLRRPLLNIQYDIELDYILKKNGILMNSFGIQPIYPFVNRRLAGISIKLGKLNRSKTFYKVAISRVLGEHKTKHIAKAGGATDVEYLFEGYNELILELLNKDFFTKLLSKKRLQQIKADPLKNTEKTLRLLYIYTFQLLFLSGRFSDQFEKESVDTDLKSLLKTRKLSE